MAINYKSNINLGKAELQNAALHKLGTAPASPVTGQVYYDTGVNRFYGWNGSGWVTLDSQGSTAANATNAVAGIIQLAGDLNGTGSVYTAPIITQGAIDAGKISATLKPSGSAAAGTEALRALGTTATTAAAGNDARLSDTRTPTDASVTGGTAGAGVKIAAATITAANIANATITDVQIAAANKDGIAGTASLRTLGTGAQQAAAGNDGRFHTQNTDSGTSGASFYLVGVTATDVRVKKTASSELSARLGDDSGYANFQANNITANGNLTVLGTTTTINSNTLSVGDNIVLLNNDVLTTAATTENAGIDVQRFTGANVAQNVSSVWDESTKRWGYTFPASSGTATVTKPASLKHVELAGVITGGAAYTITHGLNTRDVVVSLRDTTTNELVYVDAIANGVDTVQLTFAASYATGAFQVTVIG